MTRQLKGVINYGVTVNADGQVELLFIQPDFAASCAIEPEYALDLAAGLERLARLCYADPEYKIAVIQPSEPGAMIAIWRGGCRQIACSFAGEAGAGAETYFGMRAEFAEEWAAAIAKMARGAIAYRDGGSADALGAAMGPLN